jgi:hypothetical protein
LLYRLSYRTIYFSLFKPTRLNRAAKIRDNPKKQAKTLKRIPSFLNKKAPYSECLLAYSLFMPLLQSLYINSFF